MRNTILMFLLLAFLGACKKAETIAPVNPPSNVQSNTDWTFNLFKKVNAKEDSKENILLSPLSIYTALGMAYNGANADTKTAMEKAMALTSKDATSFNQNQQALLAYLSSADKDVVLNMANSIWCHKDFNVLVNFINQNKTFFGAEVKKEDFRNPNTVALINNWVSDKTNKKITTIVDGIPESTVLYLINAVYFNGNWTLPFDKEGTHNLPFTLENGTNKDVAMMNLKGKLNYFENEQLQLVDLPYGKNNAYSMTVLLPKGNKTASALLEQLTESNWKTWLAGMKNTEDVFLKFPRFKFGYAKTLNETLSALGMDIAFTDRADFSKISAEKILISQVLHKTYIDVNETGTEAAAVTSIGFETTSVPVGNFMTVNRPFVFLIREAKTGTITFIGKIVEPK
jgi:serine protease inhibitor